MKQQAPAKSSHTVDLINIGLMLLSCLLAFRFPFNLFLLAYAILGPLHYLTEIFWLRERNYFLQEKRDYRWLMVFTVLLTLICVVAEFPQVRENVFFKRHGNSMVSTILFTGFVCSIALVLLRQWKYRIILMAASAVVAAIIYFNAFYLLVFGLLMATLTHVSLFTFLFILQGAVKSKSIPAYLSLLVYLACVAFIMFAHFPVSQYSFTQYVYESYLKSNFHLINMALAHYITGESPVQYNLLSEISLRIQAFIAFSYTYHYLNWFSKAEVIKWNRVPQKARRITLVVWLLSVALYVWDYKVGLLALLFLSLTHVFLEFPLNVHTILGLLGRKQKG